jgi:hypothetical protein
LDTDFNSNSSIGDGSDGTDSLSDREDSLFKDSGSSSSSDSGGSGRAGSGIKSQQVAAPTPNPEVTSCGLLHSLLLFAVATWSATVTVHSKGELTQAHSHNTLVSLTGNQLIHQSIHQSIS